MYCHNKVVMLLVLSSDSLIPLCDPVMCC